MRHALATYLFLLPEGADYAVQIYDDRRGWVLLNKDDPCSSLRMATAVAEHNAKYQPTRVIQVCRYVASHCTEPLLKRVVRTAPCR